MTEIGVFQVLLYLIVLLLLIKPVGWYMAQIYQGKPSWLDVIFQPLERLTYYCCGIDNKEEMDWKQYLATMLFFNLIAILFVYAIQRFQYYLPLNPQHFGAVAADLAFNTATSFVTNTDWQAYSGESSLSYLTQMLALTTQNFVSAATGMSLLVALIRSIVRHETSNLGNFWVDTVRGTLYILLPLAIFLALTLVSQGIIQNFKPYKTVKLLQPITYQQGLTDANNQPILDAQGKQKMVNQTTQVQVIPMGPVASQIAIKQLGTNGGGFFNTNSAHPYENPNPITNFLEMIAILLIPAAFCYTYGVMIGDKRQGWAILLAMSLLLIPLIYFASAEEQRGNPAFTTLGIQQAHIANSYPGGNMEGKETRFGISSSTLWATITTATGNGSVNAMLDSFTPLGGLVPLWMMHLGEVVFGGVGSGLYGMLMLIIITVFVAGLMVGRTPEYMGKKIEPFEMKMACIAVLIMPLTVLIFTSFATITKMGTAAIANPGAHGFTEILYTFTSLVNNNGSAFAGLNANTSFYNSLGGIAILMGRYWIAIPMLALAGSLARKKTIPNSLGTLPTHTLLFIFLLIGVVIILGALTFLPALALGPIVEHLLLWSKYGH